MNKEMKIKKDLEDVKGWVIDHNGVHLEIVTTKEGLALSIKHCQVVRNGGQLLIRPCGDEVFSFEELVMIDER